jgi:hypothetical protein
MQHRNPRIRWIISALMLLVLAVNPGGPFVSAQESIPGMPPRADGQEVDFREAAPGVPSGLPDGNFLVFLPITSSGSPGFQVNIQSRQDVQYFYLEHYLGTGNIPIGWTGSQGSCSPGSTSPEFQAAVLRRINWFRSMAGVPGDVVFSEETNRRAQAAALIMSANRRLSHSPPPDWACYSADGAAGAGTANLFLGLYGWNAISGYMRDPGSGNSAVGHRRWILYPRTRVMGTGDVPDGNGYSGSNALVVFGSQMWGERPATRDGFVAWPPPGFVPSPVVFPRWSFSYPNADFSTSTISMSKAGADIPVTTYPVANGYGENTLVWIPAGMSEGQSWPQPAEDERYTITIHGVGINGQQVDFSYDVMIFNPGT